jgi:selenide,water dikinase
MARGSGLTAKLSMAKIPLLSSVLELATSGFITGASERNWAGYGHDVVLGKDISPVQKALLTDPQTSGGLLVACEPSAVAEVLALFAREGFAHASVIGEMVSGSGKVEVMN